MQVVGPGPDQGLYEDLNELAAHVAVLMEDSLKSKGKRLRTRPRGQTYVRVSESGQTQLVTGDRDVDEV